MLHWSEGFPLSLERISTRNCLQHIFNGFRGQKCWARISGTFLGLLVLTTPKHKVWLKKITTIVVVALLYHIIITLQSSMGRGKFLGVRWRKIYLPVKLPRTSNKTFWFLINGSLIICEEIKGGKVVDHVIWRLEKYWDLHPSNWRYYTEICQHSAFVYSPLFWKLFGPSSTIHVNHLASRKKTSASYYKYHLIECRLYEIYI